MVRFARFLNRQDWHPHSKNQSPLAIRSIINADSNNQTTCKDFCNSFWGHGGYEILIEKIRISNKMLDELKIWFKERALIEADYSKKLLKLSKSNLFQLARYEGDGLQSSLESLRQVTAKSAHSHAELSGTFKVSLESKLVEFINKRDGARKNPQASVEKLHKKLTEIRSLQEKARKKFETDAISVNGYTAQMHLVQGRELDKISTKLDKAQGSIGTTERDYRMMTRNLEETTENWNLQWKSFCDLMQDLEEDRIDFVRSSLWDLANGVSTVCILEDEFSEALRQSIEKCNTTQDVIRFIQKTGTGQELYAAPGFIDYSKGEHTDPQLIQHKYPKYELANFTRVSGRDDQPVQLGSASIIHDLASAIDAGSKNVVSSLEAPSPPQPTELNPPTPTVHQAKRQLKRGGNIAEVVASNSLPTPAYQAPSMATPNRSVQWHTELDVIDEQRRSIIYDPKHHDSFHGMGILVNQPFHPSSPSSSPHLNYPSSHQAQQSDQLSQSHRPLPDSIFDRPLPPHPTSVVQLST